MKFRDRTRDRVSTVSMDIIRHQFLQNVLWTYRGWLHLVCKRTTKRQRQRDIYVMVHINTIKVIFSTLKGNFIHPVHCSKLSVRDQTSSSCCRLSCLRCLLSNLWRKFDDEHRDQSEHLTHRPLSLSQSSELPRTISTI